MKRIINLTLLFSLLAMLSCGSTSSKQPSSATNSNGVTEGGKPIQLNKQTFLKRVYDFEKSPQNWVYAGDKPCIIDFYASWCGPCKTIAPILEDLAKEYDGQIYIYKVDVDAEPAIAAAFGVQSIPTILFSPMTGTPQMSQGAMPKESFQKMITEVLLKK